MAGLCWQIAIIEIHLQRLHRQRAAVQIALVLVTTGAGQEVALPLLFHTFGNHHQPQRVGQRNNHSGYRARTSQGSPLFLPCTKLRLPDPFQASATKTGIKPGTRGSGILPLSPASAAGSRSDRAYSVPYKIAAGSGSLKLYTDPSRRCGQRRHECQRASRSVTRVILTRPFGVAPKTCIQHPNCYLINSWQRNINKGWRPICHKKVGNRPGFIGLILPTSAQNSPMRDDRSISAKKRHQ